VKLKTLASPNFLSAIYREKLHYQNFMKIALPLLMKMLYEIKAKKLIH